MDDRTLKMKVAPSKLLALHRAHNWILAHYEIESDHDILLQQHAVELRDYFEKQLQNKQKKYGLKFTHTQALAFCQLWAQVNLASELPGLTYEVLMIQDVNNEIDKYRKSLRHEQNKNLIG